MVTSPDMWKPKSTQFQKPGLRTPGFNPALRTLHLYYSVCIAYVMMNRGKCKQRKWKEEMESGNRKWKQKKTFEVSGNVEMGVASPYCACALERSLQFSHALFTSTSCWYDKDHSSSMSLVKFVSLHTLDILFGGLFQRWTLQRYVLFMPDFGSMFQVEFFMHTGWQCCN